MSCAWGCFVAEMDRWGGGDLYVANGYSIIGEMYVVIAEKGGRAALEIWGWSGNAPM